MANLDRAAFNEIYGIAADDINGDALFCKMNQIGEKHMLGLESPSPFLEFMEFPDDETRNATLKSLTKLAGNAHSFGEADSKPNEEFDANANADMLERLEQIRADIKANLESDALSNPESL